MSSESPGTNEHIEPRYTDDEYYIVNLCNEFLSGIDSTPDTGLYCFKIGGESKYSDLGRFVETSVFNSSFGNDSDVLVKEYAPYESISIFYAVIDLDRKMPVSVMRVLKPDEVQKANLKTAVDLDTKFGIESTEELTTLGLNPNKVFDIATLATIPQYRGSNTDFRSTSLLYRSLYVDIIQDPECEALIAIIDKPVFSQMRFMGFPFEKFAGLDEFEYLGSSKSLAVVARADGFLEGVVSRREQLDDPDNPRKLAVANLLGRLSSGESLDASIDLQDR